MDLRIFTREPDDPRWVKGSRYQADNLTGVIGTASTDKLNKTAHGMATGQLFKIVFASGFTGLTTTGQYYAIKIDDDNIKAATSLANALAGTAINITADGTGATITPYVVGYENMYITDRSDRVHRAKDYYELTLTLKGILGTKPYKRRINGAVTTSNAIFPDGAVLSNDTYINYPPAALGTATMGADPGNTIEYSAATLSLVDSWVQVGPPPTDYIGAFWTPPDAPDVVTASLPGGGDLKYFFPWGWHCTSMPCEQLPGLDLWLVSATFNYQVPYIPQST